MHKALALTGESMQCAHVRYSGCGRFFLAPLEYARGVKRQFTARATGWSTHTRSSGDDDNVVLDILQHLYDVVADDALEMES
jgi:hypothetical protein